MAESIWPGVTIVPTMLPGYTDGKYLNPAGVPTYGVSGLFEDAEGNLHRTASTSACACSC